MIPLENLDNGKLRKAIEFNFYEILNSDPSRFEQYFKTVYYSNTNMVINIFFRMVNDDFSIKYPNILFNISKFIFNDKKDYDIIRNIPANFYNNNKKEYLYLFKIALNNCIDEYSIMPLLNAIAQKTNDQYFLMIRKLLTIKLKENVDAHNIFSNIIDISNLQEIYNNWDKYRDLYYQQSIHRKNDIEKIKDILCKKLYNVSLEQMMDRYYQYVISNRTNEIDNKIIYFEKIIMSISKEEIIQLYNETIDIDKDLKNTYESIACQIDIDSKKSISELSRYQVSKELKIKTTDNTDIYDISEAKFNLIIHNISAGLSLSHKEIAEKSNIDLSVWNNINTEGSITISTSEISNKYLGHLTRKKNEHQEVIFAFSNIPEEEIFFSGVHDIGLNTRAKEYSELSPADGKGQNFLANQLMTNCFNDYNEIAINRFYDKTKTRKRTPNYIVCYDEVNELSLKYAKYFNIPILYIDTKRCAYKNASEIKDNLVNTCGPFDLLNNINELFSFLCGLKYSDVVFEIVNSNNWEEIIMDSIKGVLTNIKNSNDAKKILLIINYIEKNIPKYLDGLSSNFNNAYVDYSEIVNKFTNLSQKISSIKELIYNELTKENVSLINNDVNEEIESKRR